MVLTNALKTYEIKSCFIQIMKHWKAEGCDAKDSPRENAQAVPGTSVSLENEEAS